MKKINKKGRIGGFTREEPQVYFSSDDPIKSLLAHTLQLYLDDIDALNARDRSHFIVSHVTEMSDDEEKTIRKILREWIDTWQLRNICDFLGYDADKVCEKVKEKLNGAA